MTANSHPIYIATPMQLIRMVFGMGNNGNRRDFGTGQCNFFCAEDPTLSPLDAPEILPSGSMRRWESICGAHMPRESICYRGGTIDAPFQNF